MKKIIIVSLMVLMMTSIVSATNGLDTGHRSGNIYNLDAEDIYGTQKTRLIEEIEGNGVVSLNHTVGQISYTIRDFDALHIASQRLENLNEKDMLRVNNMKQVTIENTGNDSMGKTYLYGKEKAKLFGFINVEKTNKYLLQDNEIVRQRTIFDWLWSEE